MAVVGINGIYADAVVDIRDLTDFIPAAVAPNQSRQTVPLDQSWELIGVSLTVTTSATVGNRTHVIRVRNTAGNIFYQTAVGANLAASQTNARRDFFFGGTPALAPGVFVPGGLIVEGFDAAAIDAAGDTINLSLVVRRRFRPN